MKRKTMLLLIILIVLSCKTTVVDTDDRYLPPLPLEPSTDLTVIKQNETTKDYYRNAFLDYFDYSYQLKVWIYLNHPELSPELNEESPQ